MFSRKSDFHMLRVPLYLLLVLSFLIGSAALPTRAYADSLITVNSTGDDVSINGFCTLREAIINANNNAATNVDCAAGSANDTIVFSAGLGTVTLTLSSSLPHITDASGLTMDGDNRITISGNDLLQIMVVDAGALLTLQKISIVHGLSGYGGGLFNLGTVNINLSSFAYNSANVNSGAIYNYGLLTITSSSISYNNAVSAGGGILNAYGGTMNISNSLLWNNHATGPTSMGGAILSSGTVSITASSFSGNTALVYGGAVVNTSGTLNIDSSSFLSNHVTDPNSSGGGVELNGGTVNILRSTFSNNQAVNDGGGISLISSGTLNVTNSTFADNSANVGGAVANGDGLANVLNSTFTNNSANNNLGADIVGWNSSVTYVKNTILANSVIGNNCDLGAGASIFGNNNIIESTVACSGIAAITSDPKLDSPTGSPYYYTLYPGSPAINAGDDNVCMSAPVNNTSQNGIARPQGVHCDIGSVEKTPIFSDVPLSYWANSFIERLYMANITGGCGTGPLIYCPLTQVTRAQMAIFLLRGIHGSSYTPPSASGTVFNDVTSGTFGAAWIERLASEGITSGCGSGNFCPNQVVTRSQMAVFLVRAKYGVAYVAPPAVGIFSDVPVGSFGANQIEKLVADGIATGCGGGLFCPAAAVKRDQMAVFLVRAFALP